MNGPLQTTLLKNAGNVGKNKGKAQEFCLGLVWEILDPPLNYPVLQFTEKGGFSAKGKVPWIEYNGETVADSQFIIKYLNKKFGKGLFTPSESESDFFFDLCRWCYLLIANSKLNSL